ncbi:hypothetical protein M407DRAFT_20366 [Tulasnella calospora MUT 4182]|uniref:Uncharacterized protein n=1 Tax=Tulasnella calospora MUT 4182 TaxID=1051891 RepID=A0A0C3QQA3_9AGAM|nr:hypothetical protein M407DRAFT_20366 [Tulasnella calospora MUT 4182]
MSSAPPVERFKGIDWEECNEFILAIRTRAFWEGKQRDPNWMADFAATNVSHKALLWHSRLPEDVRQDWSKLEAAFFDRWAPPEYDEEPQDKFIPAAAPSLNRNDKSDNPLQGILKLVLNESDATYYASFPNGSKFCRWTEDVSRAIHVRCNSSFSAALLERIDPSCHSWLAVQWNSTPLNLGNGSTNYTRVARVDSDTLKSSLGDDTPFQLMTCTVLANGEVIPVWKKDETNKTRLFAFINSSTLYLAPDPEAYSKDNLSEKRVKLFVEPIY